MPILATPTPIAMVNAALFQRMPRCRLIGIIDKGGCCIEPEMEDMETSSGVVVISSENILRFGTAQSMLMMQSEVIS